MTTRKYALLLAGATLLGAVPQSTSGAQAQHARIDQSRIANDLLHGNARQRSEAVAAAEMIGPKHVGPPLRRALVAALESQARIEASRFERFDRGEKLVDQEDPEFIAGIARVVADLREPSSIPALAAALGVGIGSSAVEDALVEFGDVAVPSVVAIARSNRSNYGIDDALIILRHMVEESGERPLSKAALGQIRSVTKQRLSTPVRLAASGVTLRYAIDLAMAQHDPELTEIVRKLATDRSEVVAQGITDERGIKMTMQRASERLAGRAPPARKPKGPAPKK